MYLQGYNMSVAVTVGFIALAGVTVGNAIMMLAYLNQSLDERRLLAEQQSRSLTASDIRDAVMDGAVLRLRPIMMTVCTILFGLVPRSDSWYTQALLTGHSGKAVKYTSLRRNHQTHHRKSGRINSQRAS